MKIAPSILACDYSCMGSEVRRADVSGADCIHLDIMDGHFVPNISFGADVVKSIRDCTTLPFDVHLMVDKPQNHIKNYVYSGADIITIHEESDCNVRDTIDMITNYGINAGLSVKPNTPIENVFPYLDDLFVVLIMTVEPGRGGQLFMPDMMNKVTTLKREIASRGLRTLIQVDGGINRETVKVASDYGVDICVVGTALFGAKSMPDEIKMMHGV